MMRPLYKKVSHGFTLLEILVTIVIISIVAIAVAVPLISASIGLGQASESRQAQLSALAQKEIETITAPLSGMTQSQWTTTITALVSGSPATATPDVVLDGRGYRVVSFFSCMKSDFTADPLCSDGFAKVVVTVSEVDGNARYDLTYIKTRAGL